MLGYFYFNDCQYQSILMGIMLAVTLMVLITSIEEAYNPIKFDFESFDSDVSVKEIEM